MKPLVDSECKQFCLFGTREEFDNIPPEIQEMIDYWKSKKYQLVKYVSGNGDMKESIKQIILNHVDD